MDRIEARIVALERVVGAIAERIGVDPHDVRNWVNGTAVDYSAHIGNANEVVDQIKAGRKR